MAIHRKKRSFINHCFCCGAEYLTGSSASKGCSLKCRILKAAEPFAGIEGCWEWSGSRNPATGYGQLSAWSDGKRTLHTAHRLSYEAHFGPLQEGHYVLHRCDNPACFNPTHLFSGTARDNVRDMISKGRARHRTPAGDQHWSRVKPDRVPRGASYKDRRSSLPRGEDNHNAKLTADIVREIRESTLTLKELSEKYGVSQSSLSAARNGRTWGHVD